MHLKDTTNLTPEQLERLERKRAADRAYGAAHCEEAKARSKAWYHSNKQRAKLTKRLYREAHKDEVLAAKRSEYRNHVDYYHAYDHQRNISDERRIYNRDWARQHAERNRAKVKAWGKANPERARLLHYEAQHRRRARLAGVEVEKIDRNAIFERDNNICGICGKRVPKHQRSLDHILPISQGGAHIESNVQLAHLSCNKAKAGGRLPSQLRLPFSGDS